MTVRFGSLDFYQPVADPDTPTATGERREPSDAFRDARPRQRLGPGPPPGKGAEASSSPSGPIKSNSGSEKGSRWTR